MISLVLVNALAVNSITGERDGLALDLLLATDLSPQEFIFGKLIGVLYVAKEMILLPITLVILLAACGVMTYENMVYVILVAFILYVFVVMLGLHSGLNYVAGRTAILASLGTVFFLCVGIAICMTIMVSFVVPFSFSWLISRDDSRRRCGTVCIVELAESVLSDILCFIRFALVTFYAITQFLLQTDHLYVFFALLVGYVFTTAAMIPSLSDFDVSSSVIVVLVGTTLELDHGCLDLASCHGGPDCIRCSI